MDKIFCLMPFADGQFMDPETYLSIASQTVKPHLMPVSRPFESYVPGEARPGRLSMTKTRNILREEVLKKDSHSYVLYLDSDVVFNTEHDIFDMIEFLNNNPDITAVGLNTKENAHFDVEKTHVRMACMMIRKSVLEKMMFHNGVLNKLCNCLALAQDIKTMGGKIRYLDGRQLHEVSR